MCSARWKPLVRRKIIIAEGSAVIGSVRTNEAEVRGEFDGSMQVKGKVSFYPRSRSAARFARSISRSPLSRTPTAPTSSASCHGF